MTTRQSSWTTTEPQSVDFVELFFDLVFVYAVTQTTSLLVHDLTFAGVGHAFIVLWLVWWAWTQFTWTLNPADTTHSAVRLVTLAAAGSAFFMAQAVPEAFGAAGPWFGISYVVVRILGMALQVEATWGTDFWTGTRLFVGTSMVGLAVVAVGSFMDSPAREIAWAIAIVIDVMSAGLAGERSWTLHAKHFAERHGLIIIIALGESLIAAGVAVADAPRGVLFAVAAIGAVVLVSAAWWIYFGSSMNMMRDHFDASAADRRGAVGRDLYSLGHLPIVAGIIAFAVGVEEVLAHPDRSLETPALAALAAGTVLYVGGVAWGRHKAAGESLVAAGVFLAAIVGMLVVTASLSGLVALFVVAVGLLGYAVSLDRQPQSA